MKANIGVDADSGLVHTVRGTAGNVNDEVETASLLHGQEVNVFGDAGYQGAAKRPMLRPTCAGTSPCARASAPSSKKMIRWTF